MKHRFILLVVLLLVLALAIPASAATWRNLGTATAVGNSRTFDSASPGLDVMARNARTVQVGVWQNSGRTRNFDFDYYVTAYNAPTGSTSKSGSPSYSVRSGSWKWVTIWSKANAWDSVSVNASAYRAGLGSHYQGLKVKVRVR